MSRISAIGQTYVNRISFKADDNKPKTEGQEPAAEQGMSQNAKIGAGVGAALALVALGVAGYHGKLGKGIQKMLGNGEKAVENAANNGAEVLDNVEKKASEVVGTVEKAVEKTEKNSSEVVTSAEKEAVSGAVTLEKAADDIEPNTESASKAVKTEVSEEAEGIRIFTKEELNELINTTEEKINLIEKEFGFANGVFKNEEAKEKSYGAITRYMESLNLGEPNTSSVEFYDKFMDRIMKGYSSVIKKENEFGKFAIGRAYVKFVKGDINAAEKFITEGMEFTNIFNRYPAFVMMNNIAKAQNNPEKAARFFADNVKGDIEASKKLVEHLQDAQVKELLAKDSSTLLPNDRNKVETIVFKAGMYKRTFETYIEDFESIYGEKNPEIISIKNILNELNKLF